MNTRINKINYWHGSTPTVCLFLYFYTCEISHLSLSLSFNWISFSCFSNILTVMPSWWIKILFKRITIWITKNEKKKKFAWQTICLIDAPFQYFCFFVLYLFCSKSKMNKWQYIVAVVRMMPFMLIYNYIEIKKSL